MAAALALAAPAHAEDADLRLEIRTGELRLTTGGDPQALVVVAVNDGPSPVAAPVVNFQVPLGGRGATIAGTSVPCNPQNGPFVLACPLPAMNPGQSIEVSLQLAPPPEGSVAPGENVNEDGNAWVSNAAGGDPNSSNDGGGFKGVLSSDGSPVTEVSGSVMDGSSGEPLAGATVEVTDSVNVGGQTITDTEGRFSYRADPQAPMRSGRITVKASKAGYDTSRTTVDANGGSVGDVQLAISPAAASPSPSPTPSAAPTSAAAAAPPVTNNTSADDDSSVSLLVIVLVSLLAIAVLAAGGLWVGLRRNKEQDPAPAPRPGGGPPRPNLGDAPTVQLRMPNLAGTQVMPAMSDHAHSLPVDETQRIPLDPSQFGPPTVVGGPVPGEYDQTAPFGPPVPPAGPRLEQQTTAFTNPPGTAPHAWQQAPPTDTGAPLAWQPLTHSAPPPPHPVLPEPPPRPAFPPPPVAPQTVVPQTVAPQPPGAPQSPGAPPPPGAPRSPAAPQSPAAPPPPAVPGPTAAPQPAQPSSQPQSWFEPAVPVEPAPTPTPLRPATPAPGPVPGSPLTSQTEADPPISALTTPTAAVESDPLPRRKPAGSGPGPELRAALDPGSPSEPVPPGPHTAPTDTPFIPPAPQRVPPYLDAIPAADQDGRHVDDDQAEEHSSAWHGRHSADPRQ
jgi:hypothetical protein